MARKAAATFGAVDFHGVRAFCPPTTVMLRKHPLPKHSTHSVCANRMVQLKKGGRVREGRRSSMSSLGAFSVAFCAALSFESLTSRHVA